MKLEQSMDETRLVALAGPEDLNQMESRLESHLYG
jgi:hypothetical protein